MKILKNYLIASTALSLFILAAIVVYAQTWTAPSLSPPDGNTPAPLNVSNVAQSKNGGLMLNTGGATNGLIVAGGNVGIGTTNPLVKLDVAGTVQMTGFKMLAGAGPGLVLTANAQGDGTWQPLPGGAGGAGGEAFAISGADIAGWTCAAAPSPGVYISPAGPGFYSDGGGVRYFSNSKVEVLLFSQPVSPKICSISNVRSLTISSAEITGWTCAAAPSPSAYLSPAGVGFYWDGGAVRYLHYTYTVGNSGTMLYADSASQRVCWK